MRWPNPVRKLILTASLFALGALAVSAQDALFAQGTSQPLSLEQAWSLALQHNPDIRVARLQRPIDLAGIAVAGERPNPEVAYERSKETPRQSVGVTVPIELGGKRGSRLDVARATAAVGDADLDRVLSQTRNDVRRAYFDLVAARLRVELLDEVRALADRARAAAAARVNAGDVPRSDLTQADLAVAMSDSDLMAARGEMAAARVALNTLLGQPADTPLTLADPIGAGVAATATAATQAATPTNTEIQVLDRRIAEQRMKVALAQAMRKPDLAAGTAFTYDAEPEFRYGWRVSAGLTIPLFTTHRATVAVEDATLALLIAERDAAVAKIGGAVSAALERVAAARAQVDQYQSTIVPLAADAERQAQAAYSGGQTGLPVLVQALQTARDTRQRGLQAAIDYQHALADLERAIGAPIK